MIGTTNKFFQNFTDRDEQWMLESLINEAIQIYGVDCVYIPRNYVAFDQIYGTDTQSSYTNWWTLAIYMNTPLGFTGDKEFMSKFAGLEIRDQLRFSIPYFTFNTVISSDARFPPLPLNTPGPANRPREGDVIWFPFNKKCFQIKFVNLTEMFWQLGRLYTWEVTTELFEYSGEVFNTGIADIDRIMVAGDLNMLDYLVTDAFSNTAVLTDPKSDYWLTDAYNLVAPVQQDNQAIEVEANNYINWDAADIDPFAAANNEGSTI